MIEFYTPAQVAKMFGVNANTIRRYEKHGIIPVRLPSGFRKYTIQNIRDLVKLIGYESDDVKKLLSNEKDM